MISLVYNPTYYIAILVLLGTKALAMIDTELCCIRPHLFSTAQFGVLFTQSLQFSTKKPILGFKYESVRRISRSIYGCSGKRVGPTRT